ncbi:TetR/AcrR family transcriptional regulator [Alkalihalobacillus sp. LMS6]|uniref:TetR/AcrR family transcriptional regulator n=1 Tax=Bacillaceae TaxID=186817 RepID=UPI000C086135|nr:MULTISPECIES: TetR/AcrR family transcriptional regulator [Bacillaceae]UTR05888.1 TetR/AcrR family transcriptional regulator [Alkalihalobacillus sp. LMS6]
MSHSYPDLRVMRTRRAIKSAFTQLLYETSLEKISVNTLANRAEINRVTFYAHYHDIYDLADHYISDQLADIRSALMIEKTDASQDQQALASLTRLLEYIASNQNVYSMLLVDKRLPGFTKKLNNLLHSLILQPAEAETFYTVQTPTDIARWYASSALLGTISMWLEHNMPHSPEVLAKQLIILNPFRSNPS